MTEAKTHLQSDSNRDSAKKQWLEAVQRMAENRQFRERIEGLERDLARGHFVR